MKRALLPFVLLLICVTGVTWGQLRVSLEGAPDSLQVGDQVDLRLKIVIPGSGRLLLQDLAQALDKFDLLAPPDTNALKRITLGQPLILALKVTCYEAGEQVLKPIPVVWISADGAQKDSAASEPFIVHVKGVLPDSVLARADTTAKPFKLLAPNRVKKLGVAFSEILPWIIAALAAVGLLVLVRWWLRKRRSKAAEVVEEVAAPPRPAHEIALEELDHLRDARIYQSGRIKEYYVALSEITRRYIEARYDVPAMESTSFQLRQDVESRISDANLRLLLENLLEDADLAKFAKHKPDEEICQRDLEKGYIFVRKTMPPPPSIIVAAPAGEAA
jgi:hypothetical protein